MNTATIGFLAYGLSPLGLATDDPMLLAAGAYSPGLSWELQMERAHAGCHVSAFCRNPLHPGPCKGWKHHLGLVSPGALHALEKARYEKLEESRKSKVAALLAQGKKVPKSLQTPIVYDPAKNPHITNPDKITPGLGIPTQGLTPEAAKKTLEGIPTKAQVGEKLAAKHAAEAAAAIPEPTEKPIMTTIAKAGLKPGDKVFLHGVVGGGKPTLVTVKKKPNGYQFVDENGNVVHGGGGTATKWALSPAPGKSFPDHSASNGPQLSPFDKGEKTKLNNLDELGKSQDAANNKADAMVLAVALATGQATTGKKKAILAAQIQDKQNAGEPHVTPEFLDAAAQKITDKWWSKTGIDQHVTKEELHAAVKQDLEDGIVHGKPTPVLEAARDSLDMFGGKGPNEDKALAAAVLKKIQTPPDGSATTTGPTKYEPSVNPPHVGTGEVATAHAVGGHSKAPHVQAAVDAANGSKYATATKKLDLFEQLSQDEIDSLDPNTKKLMADSLTAMQTKFIDKKKKDKAAAILTKVHVSMGGGAGAGGSGVPGPHTPAAGAPLTTEAKIAKGAQAAVQHEHIGGVSPTASSPSALMETYQKLLTEAAQNDKQHQLVTKELGKIQAKSILDKLNVPPKLKSTSYHPLVQEISSALKGESGPTPLLDSLKQATTEHNLGPFIVAASQHPEIGQAGLDDSIAHFGKAAAAAAAVSSTNSPHSVAAALAKHAGAAMTGGVADTHQHELDLNGPAAANSYTASNLGAMKTSSVIAKLGISGKLAGDLDASIGDDLEKSLKVDYEAALDAASPQPSGMAAKIDDIVADVNAKGDALTTQNGWPKDSLAVQSWKAAYFQNKVKAALGENPGAGGTSTHTSPAAGVNAPSAPSTPASPYVAPSATPKTEKGTILLKHGQALKVVSLMKSFPEGQYLESPEPKIWDNLVAISAHEGITPMQTLTTLDDQNAKKLGLDNKKLLEQKIRTWLATADGKKYADANMVPKAPLVEHLKKKDAGQAVFTNTTGIELPPGEKVQKIGGPGEFEENAPASKFGKHDVATAEADQNQLKKQLGIKFTPKQLGALKEYVDGSYSINSWLRDEHTPSQSSIDNAIYLQSMMLPTTRDHLLMRGTGWTQFPPEARSYEGLQKLVGETLEEPAFLSASVSKSSSGFGGAVKMHIQAPKGTMGVFTKDDQYHSQYLGTEAELLLAARTELKVLKVWKEGNQVQVLMRVVS